jgi:cobalt-zinc-cadmium efflux system protein
VSRPDPQRRATAHAHGHHGDHAHHAEQGHLDDHAHHEDHGHHGAHGHGSNGDGAVHPHDHDHHDHAHHGHAHIGPGTPRRALAVALGLTAAFMGVEVAVGLWSGSLSLLADAGHMLSDATALVASLIVAHIAARPRSPRNTYGYRRAEVLAALLNAGLLAIAAVAIVREAYDRFAAPPLVHGHGMLATAAGGLVVNLLAAWILHREGGGGLNVRSALFHVLGDALGSVAAMVAGVIVLSTGWRFADPLASLGIAVLLGYGVWHLVREATGVIMEAAPAHLDTLALEAAIRAMPGVASVHDLHVWSLTAGAPMLTAHVVLTHGAHGTDVARGVSEMLRERFHIDHATIQPEAPEAALVPLRRKSAPRATASG